MAYKITAEFIMDYEGEEPKRLVRLTLDAETVLALQQSCRDGGDYAMSGMDSVRAMQSYDFSTFMERLGTELNSRSLFSQEEFKATKPAPGDEL